MRRNRAIQVRDPAARRELSELARLARRSAVQAQRADERARRQALRPVRGEPSAPRVRDEEHEIQAQFFAWAAEHEARLPLLALLFAVPNETGIGGAGGVVVGARRRREGRRPGVPDVLLPAPILFSARGHGLAIEFKRPGGRVSPAQRWWLAALAEQGWSCWVCRSAADGIRVLQWYLGEGADPLDQSPAAPPLERVAGFSRRDDRRPPWRRGRAVPPPRS